VVEFERRRLQPLTAAEREAPARVARDPSRLERADDDRAREELLQSG
jgi:hypothetical protein